MENCSPVDDNVARLADAEGAIDGLVVHGGVPGGVHNDDTVGRRECQSQAAHL